MRYSIPLLLLAVAPHFGAIASNPEPLLPIFFTANAGQTDLRLRYTAQIDDLRAGFARDFAIFQSHGTEIRVGFAGASPTVRIEGIDRLFLVLSLLYPTERFPRIQRGLESANAKARGSARELLTNILSSPLREPRSSTNRFATGTAIPAFWARLSRAPPRASSSIGRPAAWSRCIEVSIDSGTESMRRSIPAGSM